MQVVTFCYLTFAFSATATESDKLHELSPKLPETTVDLEIKNDDDNEADITQYLTLAQLGNILRELSVKGKNDRK